MQSKQTWRTFEHANSFSCSDGNNVGKTKQMAESDSSKLERENLQSTFVSAFLLEGSFFYVILLSWTSEWAFAYTDTMVRVNTPFWLAAGSLLKSDNGHLEKKFWSHSPRTTET